MTTSRTEARRSAQQRHEHANQLRRQAERQERRRRLGVRVASVLSVLLVVGIVAAMMATSRSTSSASVRTAPTFTLTSTDGTQVSLADYRGKSTVVLYFNEGAGCDTCFTQMAAIEKQRAAFDQAGITVLPIVMNTREQLLPYLKTYDITTPYLLDDGTVSKAYDTLGKGMHAGLPGHGFVLIDKDGKQRWYGEYPSMWLAPDDLLTQVRTHLPA